MSERIGSFEEFWPHYLREHRDPRSRRLHFVGTTGWLASHLASTALNPLTFPLSMVGFGLLLKRGLAKEPEKRPLFEVAMMLALPTLAAPLTFPAGVAFAYGCAWTGHFGLEGNRPATFEYPLWSLVSDWKLWAEMARGRLWDGDPLEALGLADEGDDHTEPPGATVLH